MNMIIKEIQQIRKTKMGEIGFPQTIFWGKHGHFMKNHVSKLRIAKTLCAVLALSLLISLGIETWMIMHPRVVIKECPNTIDMYQATMSGGLILDK